MFRAFKHAFAVNAHSAPPTENQNLLVDRLAHEIVKRRLTTPALGFLEMSRPMNFLGAQAMHFFNPLLSTIFDAKTLEEFARFLERRDAIDLIATRIEEVEQKAQEQESAQS